MNAQISELPDPTPEPPLQKSKTGDLFENNGIIPKAEPILKATLEELTTEDFYNSFLRVSQTEEAKRKFHEKGLQVEQVLVRYFQYSEEIQKNIDNSY